MKKVNDGVVGLLEVRDQLADERIIARFGKYFVVRLSKHFSEKRRWTAAATQQRRCGFQQL
jgi:hypothetical protein